MATEGRTQPTIKTRTMKLYTEEQVREAMDFARGYHRMSDTQFIDTLTPIELPSDQESILLALEISNAHKTKLTSQQEAFFVAGFQTLSIWLRNKIQGGNK